MDTSSPVLSGLIRKRQEITKELDAAQSRVRQLILDIDAVDGCIRLFEPDIDLTTVRVRPTPRRHEAHRGDQSRMILTLLREANGEMLTHRELVIRLMSHRGMNVADKPLYETMRHRVGACLRGMRARGSLVSDGDVGSGVRWGIADQS